MHSAGERMKNINWWAVSILATIGCVFLLWSAVSQGKDIGDYSTLVQAIFTIILVFATVASVIRADTQIDKSQQQIDQVLRTETNHTLITALQLDNGISLSNLSKYAMLVRSVSIRRSYQERVHILMENGVIEAGSQLKPDTSNFFDTDLLDAITHYADHQMYGSTAGGAAPTNPLEEAELVVTYSYGGTGSRVYEKVYEIGFDVNSDYRRATGQVWMIWLELKEFGYNHAMDHGSGRVNISLEDEWNIPQPPDPNEAERARQRFMRRQQWLSLIPWRRQPEN
jgi:hypothetical protein